MRSTLVMRTRNRKRFISKWLVAICVTMMICPATPTYSATQGTLGPNSIGSLVIRVTKPARARISNLSDLSLESWVSGDGNKTLTDDVCVYSTRPMGSYTITAVGNGQNAAFTLSGGVNGTLPYKVYWNSGGVGKLSNAGRQLDPAVAVSGMNNAATDSSTCTGAVPGDTARLIVEFSAQSLDAAKDGTYTGFLTLIVTPT